jgi:hypothetical protein
MKIKKASVGVLLILLICLGVACDDVNDRAVSQPQAESERVAALERDITQLSQELELKEERIEELEMQAYNGSIAEDQIVQLMQNSGSLFAAAQINKSHFPVWGSEHDPIKEQLLREIDLNTIVDLHHNELIVSAAIFEEVTSDVEELYIPITLYRNFETTADISAIPEMSVHVKKQDGEWKVVKFSRGN